KVEEQPVSKEKTKTVEKVEKPVEKKQEKQNEYVKVEEEEEKPEVKLFIVEAFTSLFSK
ncbi:stage II sporulation protein R, partial [Bacillus mycoides]